MPAPAASPRPDVLLGDAAACRASVQPAVHALYGFVRGADEIVDGPAGRRPARRGARRSTRWQAELERGLAAGHSDHPVIAALVDAGPRHGLPLHLLRRYMDSMRVDCDEPVRIAAARAARPLHGRQRGDRRARSSPRCSGAPEPEARRAPRRRLPAHELHPRRARGLGPRPRLPAGPATRTTCAARRRQRPVRERVARRSRRARDLFARHRRRGRSRRRPRCAAACAWRERSTPACSTASRATATTCSAPRAPAPWESAAPRTAARDARDQRGAERTSLDGTRADVLICGASFAGLAVARELAGRRRRRARRRPLRDRRARDLGLRGADAVAARDGRRGRDPPGAAAR